MIKLTRLNNRLVAINPDHIGWAETTPDTTLFLISGEKLIVRETLDEVIAAVVEFRQKVRMVEPSFEPFGVFEGDPPRVGVSIPAVRQSSDAPAARRPSSMSPGSLRPESSPPRGGVR